MNPIFIAKVLGVAKTYWYVIPIALALAFAVYKTNQLEDAMDKLIAAKTLQTQLEERNRVTTKSLDEAFVRIKDNNDRIAQDALRLAEQDKLNAANVARLTERYGKTLATVKALEASAKRTPVDACQPSDLALNALEKL